MEIYLIDLAKIKSKFKMMQIIQVIHTGKPG